MSSSDDNLNFMIPESDGREIDSGSEKSDPATELIRHRVHRAYQKEPPASSEALDVMELGNATHRSKHQEFIYHLTTSGKSLADIQTAWHEYYAGLPDHEKHHVWEEFYDTHARASALGATVPALAPPSGEKKHGPKVAPQRKHRQSGPVAQSLADLKKYLLGGVSSTTKLKPIQHLQSILFGLAIGAIVLVIFLFGFFNERFIAPLIQPSRTISDTPIISTDVASGNDPEIIIPKINVEIPVVYGVKSVAENDVNKALEEGVVHYANTATPGQNGNMVIVGHSSNNIFNKGRYKFAFALLGRMDNGDTFYLDKDGKRYTYKVYEKKIVKPSDTSVLAAKEKAATVTLITCDPPGTTINRLVVVAEQVSPDPANNVAAAPSDELVSQATSIPGNAPSLWSRLVNWLF
ncbi:hypothetical protein A3A68_00375 [Candidatus Saccharibacteria bacterium RIFCSPLOWO2_01_FULL_48_13]|nr:MAG: hypothetical protein A3A68_00375 [Candidatus Saccharibacteria bacterium RIFCSPLOWO2_01_FULL_48_13]